MVGTIFDQFGGQCACAESGASIEMRKQVLLGVAPASLWRMRDDDVSKVPSGGKSRLLLYTRIPMEILDVLGLPITGMRRFS